MSYVFNFDRLRNLGNFEFDDDAALANSSKAREVSDLVASSFEIRDEAKDLGSKVKKIRNTPKKVAQQRNHILGDMSCMRRVPFDFDATLNMPGSENNFVVNPPTPTLPPALDGSPVLQAPPESPVLQPPAKTPASIKPVIKSATRALKPLQSSRAVDGAMFAPSSSSTPLATGRAALQASATVASSAAVPPKPPTVPRAAAVKTKKRDPKIIEKKVNDALDNAEQRRQDFIQSKALEAKLKREQHVAMVKKNQEEMAKKKAAEAESRRKREAQIREMQERELLPTTPGRKTRQATKDLATPRQMHVPPKKPFPSTKVYTHLGSATPSHAYASPALKHKKTKTPRTAGTIHESQQQPTTFIELTEEEAAAELALQAEAVTIDDDPVFMSPVVATSTAPGRNVFVPPPAATPTPERNVYMAAATPARNNEDLEESFLINELRASAKVTKKMLKPLDLTPTIHEAVPVTPMQVDRFIQRQGNEILTLSEIHTPTGIFNDENLSVLDLPTERGDTPAKKNNVIDETPEVDVKPFGQFAANSAHAKPIHSVDMVANGPTSSVVKQTQEDPSPGQANESTYDMTADKIYLPSTEDNYNLDDLSSNDETDEESNPRKKVPNWALAHNLKTTVKKMHNEIPFDVVVNYFGQPKEPRMKDLFPKSKARARQSSGHWESPITNPRRGESRFPL